MYANFMCSEFVFRDLSRDGALVLLVYVLSCHVNSGNDVLEFA